MAEEREIVRQRFDLRKTRRRRWDERLILRYPRVGYAVTRAVLRRRPSARVRRAMIRHVVGRAFEAANRGDYEAAFAVLPPGYEAYPNPELIGLGFERVYVGPEERLRFQNQWIDSLGDFQQEPGEIIDAGEKLVVLTRMRGTGLGSGLTFESELGYVLTMSDGRLAREQSFRSHAEALEAAGLQDQVTIPDRAP